MTREEAKEVFLNRGYVQVNGGEIFDGNKWRQSIVVISEWLKEQEPILDKIRAEIRELKHFPANSEDELFYNAGLLDAIEIIDKYKTESDVKSND